MTLDDVRARFFARYPSAAVLDDVLRSPANPTPTFFMSDVKEPGDVKGAGLALLRLGTHIERRFAISGEIAVFFAPWLDFQRRSYNVISRDFVAISDRLQRNAFERIRFSPSTKLVLVIAKDPMVAEKVGDWTLESGSPTPVVALPESEITAEGGLERVLNEMRNRMGDRDLYRAQNPVVGEDFFGRAGLLRDLATSIRGDENVAIFGLRRSGKTSVIRELKRSLAPQGVIISITDMQMLENIALEQITTSVVSMLVARSTYRQAGWQACLRWERCGRGRFPLSGGSSQEDRRPKQRTTHRPCCR